jgi:hypothetical protein
VSKNFYYYEMPIKAKNFHRKRTRDEILTEGRHQCPLYILALKMKEGKIKHKRGARHWRAYFDSHHDHVFATSHGPHGQYLEHKQKIKAGTH